MSEPSAETAEQGAMPAEPTVTKPEAEKPLGEPGLKALQAERERAARLEEQVKGLLPLKDQFEALRGVFGQPAQEGATPADEMKALRDQVESLVRRDAVNALARTHGITDEDALADLARIDDPELRATFAARLKPQPAAPAVPQTDPGQGARAVTQSVEDAEYAQFYPSSR